MERAQMWRPDLVPKRLMQKIGRVAAATPPLLDVAASAGCWRTVKGPVATLEGEEAM